MEDFDLEYLKNIKTLAVRALSMSYNIELDCLVPSIEVASYETLPINGINGINSSKGFGNVIQDGAEFDFFSLNSKGKCQMCVFSNFWQRPNGGVICGTCHPNPNN